MSGIMRNPALTFIALNFNSRGRTVGFRKWYKSVHVAIDLVNLAETPKLIIKAAVLLEVASRFWGGLLST